MADNGALFEVFQSFAGGATEMDGRTFVKCLRDAGFLEGHDLKTVDVDLVFVKCKSKGARKMSFDEFAVALNIVAEKLGMQTSDVEQAIRDTIGPVYGSGAVSLSSVASAEGVPATSGPERFFYDKSTYTGTHKHGGPRTHGDSPDLAAVVNRKTAADEAQQKRKAGGASSPRPGGGSKAAMQLPTLLGGSAVDRRASPRGKDSKDAERRKPSPAMERKGQSVNCEQKAAPQQPVPEEQQTASQLEQQPQPVPSQPTEVPVQVANAPPQVQSLVMPLGFMAQPPQHLYMSQQQQQQQQQPPQFQAVSLSQSQAQVLQVQPQPQPHLQRKLSWQSLAQAQPQRQQSQLQPQMQLQSQVQSRPQPWACVMRGGLGAAPVGSTTRQLAAPPVVFASSSQPLVASGPSMVSQPMITSL